MSRLFTFGCSFTRYHWPTWADIVGRNFDFYENWGQPGGGNMFISHSVVECNLKNKFTCDDTVIVMWSGVNREDKYLDGRWLNFGNIFNPVNQKANKFVEDIVKYADSRGMHIRDLGLIYLTETLLKSIGCSYVFLSMVDIVDSDSDVLDLIPYYKETLANIRPSIHQIIFNHDWMSRSLKGMSDDVITTCMRNQSWLGWYNSIKDSEWPECKTPEDFKFLPAVIQQECQDVFDYHEVIKRINLNFKPPSKRINPPGKRFDTHAIPNEYAEYLELVMPEFKINADTKNWVQQISSMIEENQDYSSLWYPTKTPNRW